MHAGPTRKKFDIGPIPGTDWIFLCPADDAIDKKTKKRIARSLCVCSGCKEEYSIISKTIRNKTSLRCRNCSSKKKKRTLVPIGPVSGTKWMVIGIAADYINPSSGARTSRSLCKCACGKICSIDNKYLRPDKKERRSRSCKTCARPHQTPIIVIAGMANRRICLGCKIEKSVDAFCRQSSDHFGIATRCKNCLKNIRISIKELLKEKARIRYIANKEKMVAKSVAAKKRRRKIDSNFRILENIKRRISIAIRDSLTIKCQNSAQLLGADILTVRSHIEKLFSKGMGWDNYGYGDYKWHLDHVIPVSSFNFNIPEEQKSCFHYLNLQPLWQIDNLSKSGANRKDYAPEKQQFIMVLRALGEI